MKLWAWVQRLSDAWLRTLSNNKQTFLGTYSMGRNFKTRLPKEKKSTDTLGQSISRSLKSPTHSHKRPFLVPTAWYMVVALSSLTRILGKCSPIHSPSALFFFFKVEISLRSLIPFFMPGSVHSGSASWDDRCRLFPEELRVSSFSDRYLHHTWTAAQSAHSDFVGSRVYACLGVTCHLHFLQNDRGLLRTTAVTRGWHGHRITTHKVNSGEEKSPAAPVELANFRSRVLRSYQQAIQAFLPIALTPPPSANSYKQVSWQLNRGSINL